MIERYRANCISDIWSEESMYRRWMILEREACRLNPKISEEILNEILNTPCPTVEEVHQEEVKTKHDLVAFINAWTSNMSNECKQYVHYNLTSSDIKDTAIVIAMTRSFWDIIEAFAGLRNLLYNKSMNYKYMFQAGRTHGKIAQEKTLGLTFLNWYVESQRAVKKLEEAYECLVGKMSGPLGTDKENEEKILKYFDLKPDLVPTQVISRDIFINVIEALARASICMERIALNIRLLSQSGILEVSEGFLEKQVGSSAMPHKRNPIKSERICGLSRLVRSYVPVIYENSILWGDRDISHSSSERIIFEDVFHLIYFMSIEMYNVIYRIDVHEDNIEANLDRDFFYVNSEGLMNYFIDNGITREKSHCFIKNNCDELANEFINKVYLNFKIRMTNEDLINIDQKRRNKLKENVDKIYSRIGGKDAQESPGGSSTKQ